jgi:glutathione peroxidase-family protein
MTILSMFKITMAAAVIYLSGGIYDISITTAEGKDISLSQFQNKKILITVLPVAQTPANDSLLRSLDSLSAAAGGKLTVIGVASYDEGYGDNNAAALQQWYRSILNPAIIITKGMFTHKTAYTEQHALFKWLTDKNANTHFQVDVPVPGQKFLIRKDGELFGVLGPEVQIGSRAVKRMLNTQ